MAGKAGGARPVSGAQATRSKRRENENVQVSHHAKKLWRKNGRWRWSSGGDQGGGRASGGGGFPMWRHV
jgi:hypothetical protein